MPGNRITQQNIADRAGVSRMTVSLALRNSPRIAIKTRGKIKALAEKMGYQEDPMISKLMVHLRRSRSPLQEQALAYINLHPDADIRKHSRDIDAFYCEAEEQAKQRGYFLHEFWSSQPGLTHKRLSDILYARRIPGIIVGASAPGNRKLDLNWEHFASVALGYSLLEPDLHRVISDYYQNLTLLLDTLRSRGYRRIGCTINKEIDLFYNHRFSAVVFAFQEDLPPDERVRILRPETLDKGTLLAWYKEELPDVIVGNNPVIINWLQDFGLRVPEDVGYADIFIRMPEKDTISGIYTNVNLLGKIAVNCVVDQISRGECGIPHLPQIIAVTGEWFEGSTVLPRPSSSRRAQKKVNSL